MALLSVTPLQPTGLTSVVPNEGRCNLFNDDISINLIIIFKQ